MCGRYLFYDSRNEKIKELIRAAEKSLPAEQFSSISLFEVFPSQNIFSGIYDDAEKKYKTVVMKWGLTGIQNRSIINCRSESFTTSRFFKGCRPCAIPACGYYEWSRNPSCKYYFTTEKQPLYLAGCWRIEKLDNQTLQMVCAILTEPAGMPQSSIHSRQPIIFDSEYAHEWCATRDPDSLLHFSMKNRIMTKA